MNKLVRQQFVEHVETCADLLVKNPEWAHPVYQDGKLEIILARWAELPPKDRWSLFNRVLASIRGYAKGAAHRETPA
jgi:hypothetical protein